MKLNRKMIVAALLAAGFSGLASAHTVSGSLGSSTSTAAATDVFDIDCTNTSQGTAAKLFFQVRDNATSPEKSTKLSIQVSAAGTTSALYTDTIDTDALYTPNPGVSLNKGAVVYRVTVSKNSVANVKGPETYSAQVHCQTSGGAHTFQPDPIWIQNR